MNKLFLLFFLNATLLFSQNLIQLTGKVTNEKNNLELPYTTLEFVNKENPKLVFGTITDEKGIFSIEIEKGTYTITIQAFDHKTLTLTKNISSNENFNFKLVSEVTQLDEVVIKTEKPIYRLEADKKIYDVSKDITARAGTLDDVMHNIPLVNIEADGSVTLRGNSDIRFLIDGKPSSLLGISSVHEALKMIPAENVERIEIITNPSAKYEASGSGGIINIVMKKGKKSGLNVSTELFTGYYPNNGLNTSINYGTKKWKWNFNGGIRNQQPQGKGKNFQENLKVEELTVEDFQKSFSNRERKRNQTVYNVGGGFAYDINSKQTFNYGLSFRYSDRNDKNNVNYTDFDKNQLLLREYDRNEDNDNTDKNFDSNLGYTYKITEHQKLTFDGTFNKSIEDANSIINENYKIKTLNDENKIDKVTNYQNLTSFMLKSDYELKLKENEKIEAGGRFDSRNIINDFEVIRDSIRKDDFSGNTEYDEKISALYLTYSNKYKSFSYTAGLRYENSAISVSSFQNNQRENIIKNYDNLFPTASISYELKENHQLQFSYSKRISRPSARFLLRLFNFSDDRNIFQGNPNLNPAITDSYEINYAYQTKKFTLNPGIYFKHINNQTDFAIYPQLSDNSVTISSPVNLDYQNQYGFQLIYSYNPVRFWRTFGELNFFNFEQKGNFSYEYEFINEDKIKEIKTQTRSLNANDFSWNFRFNTSLRLKDIIDFQINTNYTGRMKNELNERKPMWIANAGVSKDILKGNATLALNVQDIFNSFKRHIITQTDDFYRDFEMQFRLRQINLSFTYRFNQKKKERDTTSERKREEMMEF